MRVRLNGAWRDLPDGASVADAVAACGVGPHEQGIAAALEAQVVPRAHWDGTPLAEGVRVEVVRAAAGG